MAMVNVTQAVFLFTVIDYENVQS